MPGPGFSSALPDVSAIQNKAEERAKLVRLVNDELRRRPVSYQDIDAFRRFEVPAVLYRALGRTLSNAEAAAITAMLTQPARQQSTVIVATGLTQNSNISQCDCAMPGCSECGAAGFYDYGFGPLLTADYQRTTPRTGIINNPPFSIFTPVGPPHDDRYQELAE